jgi:hydrogenase expression/formation protein HypD
MKYLDEYRDPQAVETLVHQIAKEVTGDWTLMEVCGGQTHNIVRFGLEQLLPPSVELLHGPGCPVCVTPAEKIDQAIALATRPDVTLCSFGDMLRVPGTGADLLAAKARGGDVRVVYSPLDALQLATDHPTRHVVFFAVGFETTAPANAMAASLARQRGIANFSLLVSHVLVPPAMEAILAAPERRVDGFLAAGHVCTVMGLEAYHRLTAQYRVPIVATGFEPVDILEGIWMCLQQLEAGRATVENQYARAVRPTGNRRAQEILDTVFEVIDMPWRGLGTLPASGLRLRPAFAQHDAAQQFPAETSPAVSDPGPASGDASEDPCRAGDVLTGRLKPCDCPHFGERCTPAHPLGAPMVSSEGACAAYFQYDPHASSRAPLRGSAEPPWGSRP